MTGRQKVQRDFMITVYQDGDAPSAIRVEFVPGGLKAAVVQGGKAPRVPTFLVRARLEGEAPVTEWEDPLPPEYKTYKRNLEEEAEARLAARVKWLRQLEELVGEVEGWAKDLGWQTRRVRKELKDLEIGSYQTQALLLQKETARVLLEPVGRGAPGAEGVVDLYLLPAYDDIASLYYYDGRWNLHYMIPGALLVGDIREAEAKPLSRTSLKKVLEEMTKDVP
jgi:hypothetical protein